jgi:hypothetical protein
VKKGWQRGKIVKKTETTVLEKEHLRQQDQQYDLNRILPKKNKKPETSLDFDRDWRRLRTTPEKREYVPQHSSYGKMMISTFSPSFSFFFFFFFFFFSFSFSLSLSPSPFPSLGISFEQG